jgi:hypothetical protein
MHYHWQRKLSGVFVRFGAPSLAFHYKASIEWNWIAHYESGPYAMDEANYLFGKSAVELDPTV